MWVTSNASWRPTARGLSRRMSNGVGIERIQIHLGAVQMQVKLRMLSAGPARVQAASPHDMKAGALSEAYYLLHFSISSFATDIPGKRITCKNGWLMFITAGNEEGIPSFNVPIEPIRACWHFPSIKQRRGMARTVKSLKSCGCTGLWNVAAPISSDLVELSLTSPQENPKVTLKVSFWRLAKHLSGGTRTWCPWEASSRADTRFGVVHWSLAPICPDRWNKSRIWLLRCCWQHIQRPNLNSLRSANTPSEHSRWHVSIQKFFPKLLHQIGTAATKVKLFFDPASQCLVHRMHSQKAFRRSWLTRLQNTESSWSQWGKVRQWALNATKLQMHADVARQIYRGLRC